MPLPISVHSPGHLYLRAIPRALFSLTCTFFFLCLCHPAIQEADCFQEAVTPCPNPTNLCLACLGRALLRLRLKPVTIILPTPLQASHHRETSIRNREEKQRKKEKEKKKRNREEKRERKKKSVARCRGRHCHCSRRLLHHQSPSTPSARSTSRPRTHLPTLRSLIILDYSRTSPCPRLPLRSWGLTTLPPPLSLSLSHSRAAPPEEAQGSHGV